MRGGDAGRGVFSDNWDAQKQQPKFMLDPQKTNQRALKWDDLILHKLGFDDVYFISEGTAVPFDANYAWKDGDTIPRRLLQQGDGSHADITVAGPGALERRLLGRHAETSDGYRQAAWTTRSCRTSGSTIWLLPSIVMRSAADGITSLCRSRSAWAAMPNWWRFALKATSPHGIAPWHTVTLFYPGQVSWPHLNSSKHAGAESIKKGVPVKYRHSEVQLAHYGVEAEFADAIRRQWLLTMLAGVLLIAGFGIALNLPMQNRQGV